MSTTSLIATFLRFPSLVQRFKLLAPPLREACGKAHRGPIGPMAPGWGIDDCTLDLLEQLTERIIFLCTPPAKPPSTCFKKQQRAPSPAPSVSSFATAAPRQEKGGPREHDERTNSEGSEGIKKTGAASGVDLSLAKECLGLTHSGNSGREGVGQLDVDSLAYPDDAEEHFEEIQQVCSLKIWLCPTSNLGAPKSSSIPCSAFHPKHISFVCTLERWW